MPSKDEEVRAVATELGARLTDLRAVVAQLNAILLPPEAGTGKGLVATT